MNEVKDILQQELEKLEIDSLRRVAQLWNIPSTGKDKRVLIKRLFLGMQDDFYIKGVLEKLSTTQVTIYSSLLSTRTNIMTLGDLARKLSLPPMNTETELSVLKRYYLVYQRKNRERLTNNLDRYHCHLESGRHVRVDLNDRNKKFRLSLPKTLLGREITSEWRKVFKTKIRSNGCFDQKTSELAAEPENIARAMRSWNSTEQELVRECFYQGGLLEMSRVRELVEANKKDWEGVVRRLNSNGLLIDDYYVDDKFVRVMLLPQEVFEYLQRNPLPFGEKKGMRQRQSKRVGNEMDFYLNIKKLISYISRRGINLAKSGKIKQVDLRETEEMLLHTDISLFIEKSQIYQVELLLPIMRLLGIVRIKNQDVVLRNDHDKILGMDHFELMQQVLAVVLEERDRRSFYENIFASLDVPFPRKDFWEDCIAYIQKHKRIMYVVVLAVLIRKQLILSRTFRIWNFQAKLLELRRELTSVLFYLQLFGFIDVEYPQRWIQLSELGQHFFSKKVLYKKDIKGGLILNADMSLIAIPEKISLRSLLVIKSFAELKSFDNVYTFQISKRSFQNGMLLKEKPKDLIDIVRQGSGKELSQNFLFLIKDWSVSFPLVQITDECVVVQTKDPKHMKLLLGQINGKRIVQEKISDNTILIHPGKISEVIAYAEKLELLIKLVR